MPPVQDPVDLVTVVVPARNEATHVERCLGSIRAQTYPHLEILVVDGDSTDGTPGVVAGLARHDPRICLLPNPRRIVPVALNIALAAAHGRWLVRVDAHATVPPHYVERAVAHLRTGQWGGVGGRKDGVGRTPAGHAVAAAMGSRFGVGGSTYHHGESLCEVDHVPFGAYPVALVRELGGWDEALAVNQDFEFDHRVRQAGHRLLFDPELRIDWECRQSVHDLFRQYRRYGRGKVDVVRKHPRSLRARHLASPVLVAGLAAAALAARRRPGLAVALGAPYPLALGAASVHTARGLEPRAARKWVLPAFVAMHLGWGLGFWERLLSGLRRRG